MDEVIQRMERQQIDAGQPLRKKKKRYRQITERLVTVVNRYEEGMEEAQMVTYLHSIAHNLKVMV